MLGNYQVFTRKYLSIQTKGAEAKRVFDDAQNLLQSIIKDEKLKAKAVYGFFKAQSHSEEVKLFEDQTLSLIHI